MEGGGKEEAKEAAHGGREDSPKLTKEADSYAPEASYLLCLLPEVL